MHDRNAVEGRWSGGIQSLTTRLLKQDAVQGEAMGA